jgi:hypothetical protein
MRAFVVALLIVLGTGGTITAQPLPSFEFRGHRVGEPAPPAAEAPPPRLSLTGPRPVPSPCVEAEYGQRVCNDQSLEEVGQYVKRKMVGGVPVLFLRYHYHEGALFKVDMSFGSGDFSAIREMLVGRYGPPASETTGTVQNRAGASFETMETTWRFAEGTLRLRMRYPSIDDAYMDFVDPKVQARIDAAEAAAQREKGRATF